MPLFEYVCEECDQSFEELVRSSTQVVLCPSCTSQQVKKKISTFASKITGGSSSGGSSISSSASCAPSGL
jgi:putative FmdB family regulatory protein